MDLASRAQTARERGLAFFVQAPLFTRLFLITVSATYLVDLLLRLIGLSLGTLFGLLPAHVLPWHIYQLATYVIVHVGFIHCLLNVLAIAPLLRMFETEKGTMRAAFLVCEFTVVTGIVYCFVAALFGVAGTRLLGCSGVVFTLLGLESVRAAQKQSHVGLFGVQVPTWSVPLFWIILISLFVPSASFIGHILAAGLGYAYGFLDGSRFDPSDVLMQRMEELVPRLAERADFVRHDAGHSSNWAFWSAEEDLESQGLHPDESPEFPGEGQRLGSG
jgi:membrane associated rhomboid family serine protease